MRERRGVARALRPLMIVGLWLQFCVTLAGATPDAWPMQGHDAQRTGRTTVSGPRTLWLKWVYDVGTWSGDYPMIAQDNDSPVVAPDGTVVIPAKLALYVVNPDGSLRWRLNLGATQEHAPALSPDGATVYYLDNDGESLYAAAASTATGEVSWTLPLLSRTAWSSYSSLAVDAAGTVYLANIGGPNTTGHVWAVNPGGTEKWHWDSPCGDNTGIEAPVAVDATGNVFFSHDVCDVYALDNTGNFKWNYPDIGDYGWPTPTVGPDGTIYFAGDHDGQATTQACTALKPDGTVKWIRTDIGPPGWFAGMAISGDGNTVYTARSLGKLYALNAATGATVWSSTLAQNGDEFGGSPILAANNTFYVMGTDGTIYAADSTDGSPLWSYQIRNGAFYWGPPSPALGPDGTLYVLATGLPPADGGYSALLYAFGIASPSSAPGAPSVPSPRDSAVAVSLSPTLTWIAGSGTDSFDVYLGTSSDPPLVGNTIGTSYNAATLSASTTYYWKVVAKNAFGATSSARWSFTTQGPTPVLISPPNGATGVSFTPTLTWAAPVGAEGFYDVFFGTQPEPTFTTRVFNTSYAPGTLSPETTYYWQIAAWYSGRMVGSEIWSFTTGAAPVGLRFVPMTPCRVVDTRNPSGQFGGPTMAAGATRSFAIPQSSCGVPSTAQAYSLNVTVVPEGPLGYLTLWPTGQAQPFVSTLNSFGGIVVANAAIVPAGSGGAVSIYVTNPTDVILDIDGYFDTSSGAGWYSFYPATPCRVADTRNSTGQFGGPTMSAGQSRDFPIPLSSCNIPATARAYSLNVTVVPDGYLGYLTTWPTGGAQPNVSTLNSWTGKIVANAALVPGGTNESISVYASNPTDVILDGNGYFAAPGSPGALTFYPVTPCRVADTRDAAGPFGGPEMAGGSTRSFAIPAGACSIPSTAAAYSMNVTVVPDGPLGYLTAWPTGSAQPYVSTLNSFDGSVVANAAIVPAGTNGAISVYVTNPTHVILDINGYFAP